MDRHAYHRPASLEEALAIRAAHPGAVYVAGGTDLLVRMRKRTIEPPSDLVSLRRVPELMSVEAGERFRLGAAVPLTDLARHPEVRRTFPALLEAVLVLGSRQIQNVATLGGNLCRASPCADTAPPLLAYGARVEVAGPNGRREVALDAFFRGPGRTVLEPGEILAAVLLEPPGANEAAVYLRKGRVRMDLAVASLAVLLGVEDGVCAKARVAAGSVGPVPMRLPRTEALLEGSRLDEATVRAARAEAEEEVMPITDVRSTEAYRRALTGVFLQRAVWALSGPAGGKGERA